MERAGGAPGLERIMDEAAFAAYAALMDGVEKSQINKLLEVLESVQDVRTAALFVARQQGRGQWGRGYNHSAWRLVRLLMGSKDLAEARRRLLLFKWFYEAGERRKGALRGQLREYEGQLRRRGDAPEGFGSKFIEAALAVG